MIQDILAASVFPAAGERGTAPTSDPQRQAAEQLQVVFFKDMLMHGGFADVFSTGNNTLDSFTSFVVEKVAQEIVEKDPSLADHFYQQLRRDQSSDDS
ncbi:MAG: hypothetical protein AAGA39_10380 [Pseudomonadota bacterium]